MDPSDLGTGATEPIEIKIGNLPWRWDLQRGTIQQQGRPSVSFWLSPSLERMLRPLCEEVGEDLFRLLVADSGSKGAESDYKVIVEEFEESIEKGFDAWANMVAGSGWGRISIRELDADNHRALIRVDSPWELRLVKPGDCWGCPFLQGKVGGMFSLAFGVTCWAEERIVQDDDQSYVEFEVSPSTKTIQLEIDGLRTERMREREQFLAAEVRRQSEELFTSQEQQRSVLASLCDLVAVTDERGVIQQYYVPSHTDAVFPPAENALGMEVATLFGPELETYMQEAGQGAEMASSLQLSMPCEGRPRHYDCRVSHLRDYGAKVGGHTLVLRDVTTRRKMEEDLRHRTRMEAVGELSDSIAHDFNNLLVAIAGSAELVKIQGGNETLGMADTILDACASATGLIERMLSLSSKRVMTRSSIDMHDLIKETIPLLNQSMGNSVECHTDFSSPFSSVVGDVSQLQSALLNLGINARDAMPDGGRILIQTNETRIESGDDRPMTLGHLSPGRYLKIRVADDGHGMSTDQLERIFEPFFTTKPAGRGTGLGLTSVASTVMDHRAAIHVESELGTGSEFSLFLPLEDMESTERQHTTIQASSDRKGTVLFVEDDELVRGIGSRLLKYMGFEVILAADGKVALEIYAESHASIDVILLDLVMPVMGGVDTLKQLRARGCEKPVLIATGGAAPASLPDTADGFLTKPYTMDTLSKALSGVMKSG